MLTTLVISCCLVFIFLQLTNPYISLAKNAIKHTTTETYLISYRLANIHNIIKTISLAAYANAKYGLLLKVRYTASHIIYSVKNTEWNYNNHYRRTPQNNFTFWKIVLKLFHNNLQKNKHPNIHLQRPNDVQSNALRIYYPVAVLILYQLFSF